MELPLVTIIIPIYNAERFIERCVNSCLEQEYTHIEILLMDDGSKDNSGAICDEFARSDPRVRVIHKENSGVSDTRNLGIMEARGEYIQFMDSDDWITRDATKLLVTNAIQHECDMVIADFYRVVGEKKSAKGAIDDEGKITRNEFAELMMENPADFYYGVLWNKLYKTKIIRDHQLRMDPNIHWCEDFLFNMEYLQYVENIYVLQSPIYYYVKTEGSLVSQGASIKGTVKMKLMVFEYYQQFYKNVFTKEEYDQRKFSLYRFLIDSASDGVVVVNQSITKSNADYIRGKGFLAEKCRETLKIRRDFEVIALKYNLSVTAVKILCYLADNTMEAISDEKSKKYIEKHLDSEDPYRWQCLCNKRELHICCGSNKSVFLMALQQLVMEKYVTCLDIPAKKKTKTQLYDLGGRLLYVRMHDKCENIIKDLKMLNFI